MNIQKATQQAVEVGGVIRRKCWPWHALGGPIVIIPGNGPECCQMARIAAGAIMDKCPRWEPEIGDLTANDWTVIKDCKEIPEEPTPRIPYTPERGKFYKNQAGGTFRCLATGKAASSYRSTCPFYRGHWLHGGTAAWDECEVNGHMVGAAWYQFCGKAPEACPIFNQHKGEMQI